LPDVFPVAERSDHARHGDGHEHLGRAAKVHAIESLLRDANDGHRLVVDQDRLADDRRIAGKPALPVCVSDDRHPVGAGGRFVLRADQAAQPRRDAESGEVVA
jgi:hypothetical protein